MRVRMLIFFFLVAVLSGMAYGREGFRVTNEMIYEKLVNIEKRQAVLGERINHLEGRMEDLNRRISDLREDMNKRFEQIDKRFEQVDKRFEQVDKRFEQQDKRFGDLMSFLWILAGIFTTLVAAVIGIVIWDRRTAVRAAVKEASREMEREFRLRDLAKILEVLRERARTDRELSVILRNYGLL